MNSKAINIGVIILVVTTVTLIVAFLRGVSSTAGDSVKKIDPGAQEAEVLYFWATWCGVCESQRPMLQTSIQWLPEDAVFLTVEEGGNSPEALQQYLDEKPIAAKTLTGSQSFLQSWQIRAFPTTVFLSDEGEVIFKETGLLTPPGFILRYYLARLF